MSNIILHLNATNSRQIEPCRFSVYVTWMMRKLDGIKVHECVYVDTRAIKAHIHSNVATTQCIDHNKRNNHCNRSPNPGQQSKKVPQCSILHQNMDNWHRHNYGLVMVWLPHHTHFNDYKYQPLNGSYPTVSQKWTKDSTQSTPPGWRRKTSTQHKVRLHLAVSELDFTGLEDDSPLQFGDVYVPC